MHIPLFRSHLIVWVFFNIGANILLTMVSLLAWCSFLFHSMMMIAMIIVMAWYGACYYLDYFAYLALRKAIANGDVSPGASGAKNGNGRGDDGVIITASADENSSIDDDDDDDDEKSKIGFDYPLEDTDDDVAMTDSDV